MIGKRASFNLTLVSSATDHGRSHRYTGNYGLGTRVLDRLFGTEWDDYAVVYERISSGAPAGNLGLRLARTL